ncbi:hypothetical protein ACJZ2D_004305 [Fusarium nematophilum]
MRQAKMAQSERPDTLIVPCMIDARWEGVATSLDPESDSIIPSNFTDLSALGPFWDRAPRRPLPAGLTHGNIPIPLEWAGLLNKKDYATGFNGSMSAMETLLDNFVRRGESAAWFTPPRFREAGDGSNDPSSPDSIRNDIARTVAAIASLVIADGMSRSAYMWEPGLVLRNSAGTNLWQLLWFQEGEESDPRNITDCDLGIWYPVYWEVHRYGWGYGLRGASHLWHSHVPLPRVAGCGVRGLCGLVPDLGRRLGEQGVGGNV